MQIDLGENRYDRQELITWWDQSSLTAARVLVVGAGALGNELLKNFALLGVGHIHVVDLDTIEHSNLARCVLFREGDEGQPKAETAAVAASRLNPDVMITGETCDVTQLGLGTLRAYDVVVGGLDNREARVWVNHACRKLGITWVDGAIEGLRGVARVFPPYGACYECTLSEVDRELLARRRSCALLSPEEMLLGKVPTTSTSASVVAAIQCQETVKVLHGRADLVALQNRGFVFMGETMETYLVDYTEDPYCLAHDTYDAFVEWQLNSNHSISDLLEACELEGDLVAEFEDDIVVSMSCVACASTELVGRRLSSLPASIGLCPTCGEARSLDLARTVGPGESLTSVPLMELGLPTGDVVTVRNSLARVHFVLHGTRR